MCVCVLKKKREGEYIRWNEKKKKKKIPPDKMISVLDGKTGI